MTLLEKHARLKIRKWNLEAKVSAPSGEASWCCTLSRFDLSLLTYCTRVREQMDTDTMINKKAARGRRYSWACEICQVRNGLHLTTRDAIPRLLHCLTIYRRELAIMSTIIPHRPAVSACPCHMPATQNQTHLHSSSGTFCIGPTGLSHILTPDISPRDSPKNSPKVRVTNFSFMRCSFEKLTLAFWLVRISDRENGRNLRYCHMAIIFLASRSVALQPPCFQ
jgi:hypothetical protein